MTPFPEVAAEVAGQIDARVPADGQHHPRAVPGEPQVADHQLRGAEHRAGARAEAGKLVYQGAFRKGLAWIPAGHILRMSPPIVMDLDVAAKCMDIIDESIGEVEKQLGY